MPTLKRGTKPVCEELRKRMKIMKASEWTTKDTPKVAQSPWPVQTSDNIPGEPKHRAHF